MAVEREKLIADLSALVEPIVSDCGVELVEVELVGNPRHLIVRTFIDKTDGVTIKDCAAVSRRFSLELDNADIIDSSYTLEVSSPGLDRPLHKPADFKRRVGHKVRVFVKDARKPIAGEIEEIADSLVLQTPGGRVEIGFEKIEKGLLEF